MLIAGVIEGDTFSCVPPCPDQAPLLPSTEGTVTREMNTTATRTYLVVKLPPTLTHIAHIPRQELHWPNSNGIFIYRIATLTIRIGVVLGNLYNKPESQSS